MKLCKARIQNYRSIRDTGEFEIEPAKTILVGPNEAGKTVLLQALQQINPPKGIAGFDALRDYPRSDYNKITTGEVKPSETTVVEAYFSFTPEEEGVEPKFKDCLYVVGRRLDNSRWHRIQGGPQISTFGSLKNDILRLCAHTDSRIPTPEEGKPTPVNPNTEFKSLSNSWVDEERVEGHHSTILSKWLNSILQYVDENNSAEVARHEKLVQAAAVVDVRSIALKILESRVPVFVLYNNYFRVRASIHLDHLATRIEQKLLDDTQYDYGNECLLKLLGFSARELSNLGKAADPKVGNVEALKKYQDQLDSRSYQLNAASVRLTSEIVSVWMPDKKKAEADRLRIQVDGQYLKVVVEDELGVEIELHQRSEGFQWLVSFFTVFFAEAGDKNRNAILLLDEPGLSLHGLKQREFRTTVSRLSSKNQTLYTTHSPFLVGPDELDLVRVVDMTDRKVGTKVHTSITSTDPAALLPLQEALGYDLAQSLFGQQRNLVCEGLTDYWYLDACAQLLRDAGSADLEERIALVPAASAGKVVYYATILHAQKLKVAALLDSDAAGEQASNQDVLVHTLGISEFCGLRTLMWGR